MGDEVTRLRPAQQTTQEINVEAEEINLNTDEIEGQQIDGTQQTRLTDGTTIALITAALTALRIDVRGLGGADIDANAGDKSPQTQRVTLADDDTLVAAIRAAVAVLDAAGPANVMQVGGQVKTGVPAASPNNALVPLLVTAYRGLILAGYSRSTASLDASIVAQTKIPPIIETGWVALTVAGTFTPWRDVRHLSNPTIEYIISAIGTGVDLIIQGAIAEDRSNPFPMWEDNIIAAEPQIDSVFWHGLQVTHIRCGLVAINGGTPSVTFYLTDGNSG